MRGLRVDARPGARQPLLPASPRCNARRRPLEMLRFSPANALWNPQLRQFCRDRLPMLGGENLLVNVKDFPIHADIKRPPRDTRGGNAVRFSHLFCRVAQNWIVHPERLCVSLVCFL